MVVCVSCMFVSRLRPMGLNVLGYQSLHCNVVILSVVTKDLPIFPWFSLDGFLSRSKFSTLETRQPIIMVEFYLVSSRSHAFRYHGTRYNRSQNNTNPVFDKTRFELTTSAH